PAIAAATIPTRIDRCDVVIVHAVIGAPLLRTFNGPRGVRSLCPFAPLPLLTLAPWPETLRRRLQKRHQALDLRLAQRVDEPLRHHRHRRFRAALHLALLDLER